MNFNLCAQDLGINFKIGGDAPLSFILGPCVIESRDFLLRHVDHVVRLRKEYPQFNFIFKSSYDKANRTSQDGFRGLGIDGGLKILQEVRNSFGIPVITDVHTEEEVKIVSKIVDIVQIPAFLCRQTDILNAAGASEAGVLIKKGQFLHPEDMAYAASKVESAGGKNILLCERGSCFGYRDLVVDFRSFLIMKEFGYPVVFDVTHSVQSMGGAGGKSSGNRKYVEPLARAGVAFGINALFLECHENPDSAPSDGPNMLTITALESLLEQISIMQEKTLLRSIKGPNA